MAGKTIKLYISGDDQKSLKSAELSNWSGKAYIGERKHVPIIQKNEELSSPGIYFLISNEPGNIRTSLYIGEADEVNSRIKDHVAGKDWWEKFVVFISKDSNLTKAHVRYLEKCLYQIVKKNLTVFDLQNSSEPPGSRLPQNDIDDLEEYLEKMIFILQNLGILDFAKISKEESFDKTNTETFYLSLTSDRIDSNGNQLKAMLSITSSGYRLLKGSFIEKEPRQSFINHNYYQLRKNIENQNVLKDCGIENVFVLEQDIDFNSPSAAAAVVKNRATNGPKEWKLESGVSLDQWETKVP